MSKCKADFGTLKKENKRTNSFAHSWKTTSLRSFFFYLFIFFFGHFFCPTIFFSDQHCKPYVYCMLLLIKSDVSGLIIRGSSFKTLSYILKSN